MRYTKITKLKESKIIRLTAIFVMTAVFAATQITPVFVSADRYQEQINQLNAQNAQKEQTQGVLSVEASSLADAINRLQAQIDASEARISQLNGEIEQLRIQIKEAEIELEKQKDLLSQSIKAMYVSGEITEVEMLATSDDLSEFFDAQQYQESVRSKIKSTLDKITKLKLELSTKRELVKANLTEQITVQEQIESQQAEKNRILSLNQAEQDDLEQKIQANNGRIAELKKKQAEAEAALARALFNGSYRIANVGPVAGGAVVGSIGNTGLSSGPHLHLEVRTANGAVDPSPYIQNMPVGIPPAWVSQGYGVPNSLYYSGYHRGIDYAAGGGAPIYAIASGQLYRGCSNLMLGTSNNDYGYVAIIEHIDGTRSVYAHMSGGPAECNYNTYY